MAAKKSPAKKKKATSKKKTGSRASKANRKASSGGNDSGRLTQRVPIQLLVDYKSEGHYLFDFCRDLGTGGVFIQTAEPLPTGSSIDLTFTIPDSKETLNAKGQVIWVQSHVKERDDLTPGMGVQFAEFNNDQRKVLEDFVSRYHGDRFAAIETPASGQKTA